MGWLCLLSNPAALSQGQLSPSTRSTELLYPLDCLPCPNLTASDSCRSPDGPIPCQHSQRKHTQQQILSVQGQRLRACMRRWWSPQAAQDTCMMMSSSSSDMVNTSGPFPVLRPLVALASAALSRSDTFSFTRMPELCMHRRNQHTLYSIDFSLSEATHACAYFPPVPEARQGCC